VVMPRAATSIGVNRPADTAKPGPVNTKTGEVKEANAGGYKHGGKAFKKSLRHGREC
jgi:hypothetical protein